LKRWVWLIALVVLLILLAVAVRHDNPLVRLDDHLLHTLYAGDHPAVVDAARIVSYLGDEVLYPLVILLAIWLLVRRQFGAAALWIGGVIGAKIVSDSIKIIVARPRPVWEPMLITEDTFAFPSGHALMSFATYGLLVYLVWHTPRLARWRGVCTGAAVILVLLIGCCRMLLGLHYLSDVLGGYLVSAIWLLVCIPVFETVRLKRSAKRGKS